MRFALVLLWFWPLRGAALRPLWRAGSRAPRCGSLRAAAPSVLPEAARYSETTRSDRVASTVAASVATTVAVARRARSYAAAAVRPNAVVSLSVCAVYGAVAKVGARFLIRELRRRPAGTDEASLAGRGATQKRVRPTRPS